MSCNVGGIERAIRIFLGVALFCMAYFHVIIGTLAILAYVVGGIALVTGVIAFCPAWVLFRINTCARKPASGAVH